MKLTQRDRERVQKVIDAHRSELGAARGVLLVEPGYPIVAGRLLLEPAIIVHVANKVARESLIGLEALPRQVEGLRVDVVQASVDLQLELAAPAADAAAPPAAAVAAVAAAAQVPTYEPIAGDPIDVELDVTEPLLCHVGPDAGWVVLRDFLGATRSSLSVAMYDFNAEYIANTLIETWQSTGMSIDLVIDDGLADAETAIQDKLESQLTNSYASDVVYCRAGRDFPSAYHEKVAIQDGVAFWISSGNWSKRSQPLIDPVHVAADRSGMYGKGNREWHLVVRNKPLAELFARYLDHDRQRARAAQPAPPTPVAEVFVPLAALGFQPTLAVAQPVAPKQLPSTPRPIKVRPLLSPDNYASRIDDLVRGAKKRLFLQYSYITWSDRPRDKRFTDLLLYLGELSQRADFDLRVIVGSNEASEKVRLLVQEAGWNADRVRSQGSIHNKGIVADGKHVLVSSQNWSSDGFLRNRDAGLIVSDEEIAGYFESVFLDDWESRASSPFPQNAPAILAKPGQATPSGMVRMSVHDFMNR